MANILVIHGPNLNLLGTREPERYGTVTLAQINSQLQALANTHSMQLECYQSNSESALIEKIHSAASSAVQFIVINPAAYTHTSIALRDALLAVNIPFIELHISNVHKREEFRHRSYFSDIAEGVIAGLGPYGYTLAVQAAIEQLSAQAS